MTALTPLAPGSRLTITKTQTVLEFIALPAKGNPHGCVTIELFSAEAIRQAYLGDKVHISEMTKAYELFCQKISETGKSWSCDVLWKGKTPRGAKQISWRRFINLDG